MKTKKIAILSLAAMVSVSFSTATLAKDKTYWVSSSGAPVKDGSGKCWIASDGAGPFEACGDVKPEVKEEPPKAADPAPAPPPPKPAPAPKPQTIVLNLNEAGGSNFAFDSAKLTPKSTAQLNQLVGKVKSSRVTPSVISIVGHTDSIGKESYNQKLSVQRANSVAGYLAGQGMNRQAMRVSGKGETQPVASNKTKEGRAQNRRVEIRVTGKRTVTK